MQTGYDAAPSAPIAPHQEAVRLEQTSAAGYQPKEPHLAATPMAAPKPVRVMLARGAACQVCRERKVKCDGKEPKCSQCLKSGAARGLGPEQVECIYGAAPSSAPKKKGNYKGPTNEAEGSATGNSGVGQSRPRPDGSDQEDDSDEGGNDGSSGPNKRRKSGKGRDKRVGELVDRISDLERRLQEQAAQARAQPVATLSPYSRPVSFPQTYQNSGMFMPQNSSYPPSIPAHLEPQRRNYSNAADLTTSGSSIAASWAQESSVRFTEPSPSLPISSNGGLGTARDFVNARQSASGTFANGSSYPPLDYGPLGSDSSSSIDLLQNSSNGGGSHRSPATTANSAGATPAVLELADQLNPPTYPSCLPPSNLLQILVEQFFLSFPSMSSFIDKPKILNGLTLPPGSKGIPHPALLHAMCAFTSVPRQVGSEDGDKGDSKDGFYWSPDPSPLSYHFRLAKNHIISSSKEPEELFQILQAGILSCYVAYACGTVSDLWGLAALVARLCVPLGLNRLPPWDFKINGIKPEDIEFCMLPRTKHPHWGLVSGNAERKMALPIPTTLDAHYEQAATFWMAFTVESGVAAATNLPTLLQELDISTPLPTRVAAPLPTILIRDPNFILENAMDDTPLSSLGIYIKAVILLSRVTNYVQRFSDMVMQAIREGKPTREALTDLKNSEMFQELDLALARFRVSTVTSEKDFLYPGTGLVDGYRLSAFILPHVASILLHEPLVDPDDKEANSSLTRCSTSAACVMSSLYLLFRSSSDLTDSDIFAPFCWNVVGRSFAMEIGVRRHLKDWQGEAEAGQMLTGLINIVELLKKTHDCPEIEATLANLDYLKQNPEWSLPCSMKKGSFGKVTDQKFAHA